MIYASGKHKSEVPALAYVASTLTSSRFVTDPLTKITEPPQQYLAILSARAPQNEGCLPRESH